MPEKLDNENLKRLLDSWPERALDYLFRFYKVKLLRQSEWRTNDPSASEDIVQEAILLIWHRRDWIISQKDLVIENFLVSVVRNQSINFYQRSRGRRNSNMVRPLMDDLNAFDLNENQDNAERDQVIWDLINTFPSRERECLTLKYKNELSGEEIAAELKITLKAVERTTTRAYKRLRKYRNLFE